MNEPAVSIIMPVKNTAAFLVECLDSIINQTLENWELLAVDDHSDDNSLDILTSYAYKDKRIHVFRNNGSGIIEALAFGYKKSLGKFITRMDSDDLMEPDKLELMKNQLHVRGKGHIAVGLVEYFSEKKLGEGYRNYAVWLNNLTTAESNFSDIYKECSIPSPCWMVSKVDFDKCGGFNSTIYPEDYDLAFRFRKIGLKITAINKVIHQWRDYDTRTSRNDDHYSDNRFSELKILHFIDQDYNVELELILWGAGRKGKKIAKLLTNNSIQFKWVCNNSNKIGKDIYGTLMEGMSALVDFDSAQVIVAVSSPKDSGEVEEVISENSRHQYFSFY